jgi:hypothetical protein
MARCRTEYPRTTVRRHAAVEPELAVPAVARDGDAVGDAEDEAADGDGVVLASVGAADGAGALGSPPRAVGAADPHAVSRRPLTSSPTTAAPADLVRARHTPSTVAPGGPAARPSGA